MLRSSLLLRGSLAAALLGVPALIAVHPAAAQVFSDGHQFLEAVRERDGTKVTEMLGAPGTTIVNTRDITTGETGLHIVVARRDTVWIGFLLQRGANPALADRNGLTPLLQAAQLGFVEGARALINGRANVNQANTRGETALHIAVQRRDIARVRLLIASGADPDVTDSVTGMSARDYAARDNRAAAILAALDDRPAATATAAPARPVAGPN